LSREAQSCISYAFFHKSEKVETEVHRTCFWTVMNAIGLRPLWCSGVTRFGVTWGGN